MKKHQHKWKEVGYYDAGFGISSSCIVRWCSVCGALHKNRIIKPKGIKEMFFVEYEVEGFPGTQQAGPYSKEEVQYQRDDIAGYEGVKNVRVVKALDE